MHERQASSFLPELEDGLMRAKERDPAAVAESVPLHNASILFGLLLGASCVKDRHPECMTWCMHVLKILRQVRQGTSSPLVAFCAQLVNPEQQPPVDVSVKQPLISACAADWLISRGGNSSLASAKQHQDLRACILERAVTEELRSLPAHQAAFIWRSLLEAVSEQAELMVRSPHAVLHVLRQFQSCLRRWRWDVLNLKNPVRWPVKSEREVQDILWLMLRSNFLDVTDEDTLPKFGHATYRADFGIPSLGVLVEVKFAREAADFKKIEKEVLEDIVPYMKSDRYKEIVVFIYDDSCSVQEHELTRAALESAGLAGVVIASRPSMLPDHSTQAL
jgi:hypothetical protein